MTHGAAEHSSRRRSAVCIKRGHSDVCGEFFDHEVPVEISSGLKNFGGPSLTGL